MNAGSKQQGCGGVPAVVEPDVSDAGIGEEPRPGFVVGVLVEWSAVGLGEDEVKVLPIGASACRMPNMLATPISDMATVNSPDTAPPRRATVNGPGSATVRRLRGVFGSSNSRPLPSTR